MSKVNRPPQSNADINVAFIHNHQVKKKKQAAAREQRTFSWRLLYEGMTLLTQDHYIELIKYMGTYFHSVERTQSL